MENHYHDEETFNVKLAAFLESIKAYGHEVFTSPKKINVAKTIDYIIRNTFGNSEKVKI